MAKELSIAAVTRGLPAPARTRLKSAAAYAAVHLSGLKRRTGNTYAEHCLSVAAVLREANDDPQLLAVALLHDLPLHPDGNALLHQAPLTETEKSLVLGMHRLRRLHIDAHTEDLDRVLESFLEEPRLLPLRMAHRVSDVRQIGRFSAALRKQIAHETLHMYSAIAGRLGMHRWRSEMEDACFPVLQPKIARTLQSRFSAAKKLDDLCLRHTEKFLRGAMRKAGVPCVTECRRKGLYSSYRKMVLKQRSFEELMDRLAVRVIVPTPEDCYRALGVVHAVMHPIPGKLKDYIGAPKENGYQSIHTVVYPLPGVTEQPIEIQIRTRNMHADCEFGSAAHGKYKQSVYALHAQPARVNLFRNLESLRAEASSPAQFEEALRKYFREDHVALFDDHSNLYHLQKPASILDFVCHVHGRRVAFLKKVWLNGRERSPDTRLQDGDTVEVAFGKQRRTTDEWMHICCHRSSMKVIRSCCSPS